MTAASATAMRHALEKEEAPPLHRYELDRVPPAAVAPLEEHGPAPAPALAVIDRLEDDLAVLAGEHGSSVLPRLALPAGAREGDVIDARGRLDPAEAARRRARVAAKRRVLERLQPGGVGGPW